MTARCAECDFLATNSIHTVVFLREARLRLLAHEDTSIRVSTLLVGCSAAATPILVVLSCLRTPRSIHWAGAIPTFPWRTRGLTGLEASAHIPSRDDGEPGEDPKIPDVGDRAGPPGASRPEEDATLASLAGRRIPSRGAPLAERLARQRGPRPEEEWLGPPAPRLVVARAAARALLRRGRGKSKS